MNAEIIVHVLRGSLIESLHRGHIAVVNLAGKTIHHLGNPEYMTYARSSAKLLQAIPVIESGAADAFDLSDREIAVLCASHSGESGHVECVARILNKLNLDASALLCGAHLPFDKAAAEALIQNGQSPSSLHNNCSGKHAGMLALAKHLNSPLHNYIAAEHPVQKRMLQTISEMSGLMANEIELGVDGCGVPVFGMPINRLAHAFARLGDPESLAPKRAEACRRIIRSVATHPFYVAGTERFDSELIKATKGRLIGKMGAEGIFAITSRTDKLGIVIKVEDGNTRALYPAAVETLRQMDMLGRAELEQLHSFHRPIVKNWQGDLVGITQPAFQLR
jgi:L-asparaginase II